MYFRPKLPNGAIAPIAWQIRLFFLNINWPLPDEASWIVRLFDKFLLVAGFIIYTLINAAECNYMVDNLSDIGEVLEGLGPYMILIEMHCRVFDMAFRKQEFKQFLKEFYIKIYIERDQNRKMYDSIQRKLLPTILYSYSYMGTLFAYTAIPVIGFLTHRRLLPFKLLFPYDYKPLPIFLPTLFFTLWGSVSVVSGVIAESNMLATFILHLNGRYQMLQQEMLSLYPSLLRRNRREHIPHLFRQRIIAVVKRNVELNEFAEKLQIQYAFRIFIMMAMSAVLLCVLGFKAATLGMSYKSVNYILWIAAKILELIVFGELGSQLIYTTDDMSNMYYLSNWEDVVLQSSNAQYNAQLMKLLTLAMQLNQKPKSLMGFNFFSVSLITVVSILQCAGSYFTFLYAFR